MTFWCNEDLKIDDFLSKESGKAGLDLGQCQNVQICPRHKK